MMAVIDTQQLLIHLSEVSQLYPLKTDVSDEFKVKFSNNESC